MFRFSIRDLLWLTLVVALGLGWFVHQRELRYELTSAQLEAVIAELKGSVSEHNVEILERYIEAHRQADGLTVNPVAPSAPRPNLSN